MNIEFTVLLASLLRDPPSASQMLGLQMDLYMEVCTQELVLSPALLITFKFYLQSSEEFTKYICVFNLICAFQV